MRSTNRKKERFKLKDIILDNIYHNLREYIIVTIIFLIGIMVGVIFINHVNESQLTEIGEYINNFITALKGEYNIDKTELLKNSLLENFKLALGMWFIGSTVVGMPIVLGIVLFRGFCIGYTVSSSIAILRYSKRNYIFLNNNLNSEHYIYTSINCVGS